MTQTIEHDGAIITQINWWTSYYDVNTRLVVSKLQFVFSDGYTSPIYGNQNGGLQCNPASSGSFNSAEGFTAFIARRSDVVNGFAMVKPNGQLTEWAGHVLPGGTQYQANLCAPATMCNITVAAKSGCINQIEFGYSGGLEIGNTDIGIVDSINSSIYNSKSTDNTDSNHDYDCNYDLFHIMLILIHIAVIAWTYLAPAYHVALPEINDAVDYAATYAKMNISFQVNGISPSTYISNSIMNNRNHQPLNVTSDINNARFTIAMLNDTGSYLISSGGYYWHAGANHSSNTGWWYKRIYGTFSSVTNNLSEFRLILHSLDPLLYKIQNVNTERFLRHRTACKNHSNTTAETYQCIASSGQYSKGSGMYVCFPIFFRIENFMTCIHH